jgi:hypothetical protein
MNTHIENAAFHALNKAVHPAPEPSLTELLAELNADLEDAEAHLYVAERHSDQHRWSTERERWQIRVSALRRQIKIVKGSF